MRIATALAFAGLLASPALGACPEGSANILSCTLSAGGKAVSACWRDETASYAFGRPGAAPELTIETPLTEAGYRPWNGIGGSIYEEVTFANRGVSYTVWAAMERNQEANPLSGGILVTRDGAEIAALKCDPGSVETGFGALFERMEQLGRCWDYGEHAWKDCH
ncbi:MAG: hypothetical protein ACE5FS_03845 [Paracoccaceae bacterium]